MYGAGTSSLQAEESAERKAGEFGFSSTEVKNGRSRTGGGSNQEEWVGPEGMKSVQVHLQAEESEKLRVGSGRLILAM